MKKIVNILLFGCLIFIFNGLIDNFLSEKYETQLEGLGTKEDIFKANEKRININESKNRSLIFISFILILIVVFNLKYHQIIKIFKRNN
ncbi:hypothetical protein DMB65_01785 [Flavobacterium cheongpyeongense]|uniref:Uncharacterized protein n=1 Tax=Flavobacterium cheongpyeongense TaxID=2212651 RepID=A0A2V4BVU7_9FLAO|nr:hypothetical protein [Flavobacterium cheongpyeongense]PXY42777.1 hypothetical protein DMB65_01785 [Flavobacterium cheongpyeongense]